LSAYRLDRELGRGGMAVVYAGWQEELDRPVALKVLAEHLAGDPEFRERFLREARIASKLQHPNLVRVFDIAELDGLPCIVMELVDGPTLEGGTLTLEQAAQVADGLAHAHAHGVVHRDLKPANILLRADGTIKLVDFGIARAAEETRLTQIGTVLGTLRYLAPEQAEGRDVGPEADVYSLGVVLNELLPDQPLAVRRAVDRAVARDPRARPTAAELAAALRGLPVPAPTPAVGANAGGPFARDNLSQALTRILPAPTRYRVLRLWPAIAAALLLVAVAVGLAIGGGGGSKRPRPRTVPVRVAPVPHSADTAQQARNLAAWLRRYSR
jgi:serine/threonine protein kinase